MASLLTLVQDGFQRLADWLHATWAGLPPGAAWLGGGLLLAGVLAGATAARRAAPPAQGAAADLPDDAHRQDAAATRARLAVLEAELAALRDAEARRQDDADSGVQSFCSTLATALSALSEAAEQGRAAAADSAARADAVYACMADAAEDAARTATTLAAVTRHVESLALSVEAIATTLAAVAEAIGPEHGADPAAGTGTSLVGLAAESGKALADLVATLQATASSADAVAARVAQVRDAAESGSAAARGMARATETVGQNAIGIGLEFTAFLDGLARAGNRRKFDRYPTDLAATVVVDGRQHAAHVINISRGGCAIDGDPGLEAGTQVLLHLPGVEAPLDAVVARRLGAITGLKFAAPDPLAGLLETLIVEPVHAA